MQAIGLAFFVLGLVTLSVGLAALYVERRLRQLGRGLKRCFGEVGKNERRNFDSLQANWAGKLASAREFLLGEIQDVDLESCQRLDGLEEALEAQQAASAADLSFVRQRLDKLEQERRAAQSQKGASTILDLLFGPVPQNRLGGHEPMAWSAACKPGPLNPAMQTGPRYQQEAGPVAAALPPRPSSGEQLAASAN